MSLKIALVAGEASGDQLGGHLMAALKTHFPTASFCGIGGSRMVKEGLDAWWPMEKLAVMGFVEVFGRYREIARIRRALKARLLSDRPDLFIGIDAPDFNLWLEKRLRRQGICTIHYVSPSIWAWRRKRVKQVACAADRVLALFPMEPPLYAEVGVPVTFVGHPLADEIPMEINKEAVRAKLGIAPKRRVLAFLPGSRESELRYMADTFVLTAEKVLAEIPGALILVPVITRETRELFETALYRHEAQNLPIRIMFGHAREALAAADLALIASGTATLEAALSRCPMVVTYKMSPWSYRLMKWKSYLPYVSLPNVLGGCFVVPEILQRSASPGRLSRELLALLQDGERLEAQKEVFAQIHEQLRQDTATKAAEAVIETLNERS